jgi:hypothetical protein
MPEVRIEKAPCMETQQRTKARRETNLHPLIVSKQENCPLTVCQINLIKIETYKKIYLTTWKYTYADSGWHQRG